MNEDFLKTIAEKKGIKLEVLKEIIDCERKHVYKKTRPIFGDLKAVVQNAIKGEQGNDNK